MDICREMMESAIALAQHVPLETIESIADVIVLSDKTSLRAEIIKRVPHYHHRDMALAFVDKWCKHANHLESSVIAGFLRVAALSEQQHRDSQRMELVWTGPDEGEQPFRRTEQAILQLLDSAQKRIMLISFAVYNIPNIAHSLMRASERGVQLSIVVETPDKNQGKGEYNTIRALGKEVAGHSSVFFWPQEKRKRSDLQKTGLLHVKCAVADGEWLFLSSANLTQQAFTINMELGVLIRGGPMPRQVEQLFDKLINLEILLHV